MKEKNKEVIINKQEQTKKSYQKPELVSLGDIRDVTMGGSPGVGDSGGGAPENFL